MSHAPTRSGGLQASWKFWLGLASISFTAALAIYYLARGDGRPTSAEAAAYFESQFPRLELIGTELSENEVVACSFVFRYKEEGAGEIHRTEIQFMADPETGIWQPQAWR